MVRSAGFFVGACLYVWLWVQPCLIYSCGAITNFPPFYRGWSFFLAGVQYPGGAAQYVSALLSQLLAYSWAGAIVIVAQAWAICACTGYLLKAVRLPAGRLLRFVPAILVLVAYARYSFHLPLFLGAVAALAFACLYIRLARGKRDLGVWLVLSAVLHLVAGGAVLPFVGLCVAYEIGRGRWTRIGLYLLIGLALPYVAGVLILRVSVVNAYTDLLPLSWRVRGWASREQMIVAVYVAYLSAFVGMLIAGLGRLLSARWPRRQAGDRPGAGWLVRSFRRPAVQWTLGTLVLFAVGGPAVVLSLDAGQKASLAVHCYACRRMWPEVLEASRDCPDSVHVMNAVNRALYHTGRLSQDMFLYAQQPDGLLLTGEDHNVYYWHAFDTLIDLGLANLAEKNLTECLETIGEHPWILERLALVNLVKGKTAAARIYLGTLRKTLWQGSWAGDCLSRLDADPNFTGGAKTHRLRTDSTALFYAKEAMLTALVEQGDGNRMAFEYLMAWYLLTGQLAKVAQQIERLDAFGYAEIPPLWQEALLIYAYGTGKPVDLHGRAINPVTEQRFKHFSSVANRHGRDRAGAAAELARDYRGSYFFYYFCTVVAKR